MMRDTSDPVLRRLRAFPGFDEAGAESLLRDIQAKREAGWLDSEIGDQLKWTEEVQPNVEEEKALRRMAEVHARVQQRLAA